MSAIIPFTMRNSMDRNSMNVFPGNLAFDKVRCTPYYAVVLERIGIVSRGKAQACLHFPFLFVFIVLLKQVIAPSSKAASSRNSTQQWPEVWG